MDLAEADPALDEVFAELTSLGIERLVATGLRQAFDEVIDAERTGRYSLDQLESTEKTYIGTKIEIILRNALELERGEEMDNLIRGHEVDTKFSLKGQWMIPREAIGHICLLVAGSDESKKFSVGLIRICDRVLRLGRNQDKKASISAAGRSEIRWLVEDGVLPSNFLLDLGDETRTKILSKPKGKQRILALFRNVHGRIIPRSSILQVARLKDPMRRAREAKLPLKSEGITVLCYKYDRADWHRLGLPEPHSIWDWFSFKDGGVTSA